MTLIFCTVKGNSKDEKNIKQKNATPLQELRFLITLSNVI